MIVTWSMIEIIVITAIIPMISGVVQQAMLVLLIGWNILFILKNKQSKLLERKKYVLCCGLWIMWQCLIASIFGEALQRLLQLFALLSTFFLAASNQWGEKDLILLRNVELLLLISWLAFVPFSNNLLKFEAYYSNANTFGILAFNALAVMVISPFQVKWRKAISITACFLFILMSGSRSALIGALTCILMNGLLWHRKEKGKPIKAKWFDIAILIVLCISLLYPALANTELGTQLTVLSRLVFKKNFFSGRQTLWLELAKYIAEKPWMGYGLSMVPSKVLNGIGISSHNLYYQTALQSGLIGVVFMLLFLRSVFCEIAQKGNKLSAFTLSYLLGILLRECFEVSLTQNNWPSGMFLWFLLGLTISYNRFGLKKKCHR